MNIGENQRNLFESASLQEVSTFVTVSMSKKPPQTQAVKKLSTVKMCCKCRVKKAVEEFYSHAGNTCKSCSIAGQLERYATKADDLRAYQLRRYYERDLRAGQIVLIETPPPQRGGAA